jgi:hypothetical protein
VGAPRNENILSDRSWEFDLKFSPRFIGVAKVIGVWSIIAIGVVFFMPPWASMIVLPLAWIYFAIIAYRAWKRGR